MADPATIAMAAKTAIAVATDKNTWKTIGAIIAGFLFVLLLPLLIIMSVGSGSAENNRNVADYVFSGAPIPSSYPDDIRRYAEEMQEAFALLDTAISEMNSELDGESLDDTQVKAFFYSLYFGSDFSEFDDYFYSDFARCFIKDDGGGYTPNEDLQEISANITALTGKTLTDADRQNVINLYNYIKYGYAADAWNNGIPSEAFSDETFARLMMEATKYVGYPYVWGGSSPSTSFDCSGLVCWSYTKSGVYNLPRTTAQGIYNQCAPVPVDEIKPGDLVFFHSTYSGAPTVSHIGIYVGDGKMLHAGDPIGYANLNSSYWRQHFLAYGRLG